MKTEVLNSWYLDRENTFHFIISFFFFGMEWIWFYKIANRKTKATSQGWWWRKLEEPGVPWCGAAAPARNRLPPDFLLCEDCKPALGLSLRQGSCSMQQNLYIHTWIEAGKLPVTRVAAETGCSLSPPISIATGLYLMVYFFLNMFLFSFNTFFLISPLYLFSKPVIFDIS